MTPGAGVRMLGHDHISHFSEYVVFFYSINIQHIGWYCVKGLWCCFPIPSLIFIYSMMGLLIYKYEPLWQEVSVKSLILRWPWRSVGFLFNFVNVFSLFRNYIPFEKGPPFIWTYLSPLHPKDVWAKFGWNLVQWFFRKRFLNFVNVLLLLHNYLPLERAGSFIWTMFGPLHQRMFVPRLVEIGLVILEKKILKFLQCIFAIS